MLLSLLQIGLGWYYFNVIAISYILYMLLQIGLARAKQASRFGSESEIGENKRIVNIIVYIAIAAIIYFMFREYAGWIKDTWFNIVDGVKNGLR